jgi:hypothetical protein
MEFTITSEQIMGLCALATALFGVWKIIKEVKKPSDELKAEVEQHDRLLKDDNERLKDLELSNKMILQCLLVIINHDITGNGIDKMKVARDELQEFLINK